MLGVVRVAGMPAAAAGKGVANSSALKSDRASSPSLSMAAAECPIKSVAELI